MKKGSNGGVPLSERDSTKRTWGGSPLLGNLKDEVFERCAKDLQAGFSYYRGPDRGTWRG
jgi:hypothetical protein